MMTRFAFILMMTAGLTGCINYGAQMVKRFTEYGKEQASTQVDHVLDCYGENKDKAYCGDSYQRTPESEPQTSVYPSMQPVTPPVVGASAPPVSSKIPSPPVKVTPLKEPACCK